MWPDQNKELVKSSKIINLGVWLYLIQTKARAVSGGPGVLVGICIACAQAATESAHLE